MGGVEVQGSVQVVGVLRFGWLLLLVTTLAASTAAAIRASTPSSSLTAQVAEWSVVPSVGVVRAGRVRLVVENLGEQTHELEVVRTTHFAERFPLDGARARIEPVAHALILRPGETRSLLVTLRSGSYALVDNLPWHYWQGTSAAFTVR